MSGYIVREYHITCQFCGDDCVRTSPKAHHCSNACKQKMYRWRKRLPALYAEAEAKVDEIAKYLRFPDAKPHAVALMKTLREHVNQLWKDNGVRVIHG